jgi:hypothetical protein
MGAPSPIPSPISTLAAIPIAARVASSSFFAHRSVIVQLCVVLSTAFSFWLLLVWPAIKTLARIHAATRGHIGRWGLYWMASPVVFLVLKFLQILAQWNPALILVQLLVSVILSHNNGWLVHSFTQTFLAKLYQKHYGLFRRIPEITEGYIYRCGCDMAVQAPLCRLLRGRSGGRRRRRQKASRE